MTLFFVALAVALLATLFFWKFDAIVAYLNSRNAKVNVAAVKADASEAVQKVESIVSKPKPVVPPVTPAPVVKPKV